MNIKKYELTSVFYFLLAMAIVARIFCDIDLNRIGIHLGDVFPIRKIDPTTLPYSVEWLYFEWSLAALGAILLNTRRIRLASLLVIISYLMGMSQMFQNQKILILIIALSLFILPLSRRNFSSIWSLRYQLILIYSISALQKLNLNFLDGKSILATFQYLESIENNAFIKYLITCFSQDIYTTIFSYLTIIFEIIIPLLLIKRPKIGIIMVFVLHFSFNLLMRDILPFSLTMMALAVLFLITKEAEQTS